MLNIYQAKKEEFSTLWPLISDILKAGDTYPFLPETSEDGAKDIWFANDKIVYIARDGNDKVIGTYYLRPNQAGLGAHICNAGFMVSSQARGRGYGTLLGKNALHEAKKLGYRGMQFNLVVETNLASIKIWKKLGFEIIGKVPEAFNHKDKGFVGAYVMYKKL